MEKQMMKASKVLLYLITTCAAIYVGAILPITAISGDRDIIYIRARHYNCLMGNIDRYINAANKGTLIIILSECPNTEQENALEWIARNTYLPSVKEVEASAARPAEVIAYNKKDLTCLKGRMPTNVKDTGLIELPRRPCKK